MKIGVCEKDLPGSLEENLEWIAANKFDGFQIWKGKIDGSGLAAKDVLARAYDLGLEVAAVGGGPNLVDPGVAAESIEKFKAFFDLAAELGSRIVTAETKRKPEGLSDEDAWQSTVDTVGAICEYAEGLEGSLAIECAGGCFVRDAEMWLELAKKVGSKALTVNYDPANIVLADKDPVEGVRAVARHVVHTHAKDIARHETEGEGVDTFDVPAGEGLVDFEAYLAALRETGYDGYLTIEMHARGADRSDDIMKSAENLRRMLGD